LGKRNIPDSWSSPLFLFTKRNCINRADASKTQALGYFIFYTHLSLFLIMLVCMYEI